MFNLLKMFNLFPYPHLWRIGKEEFHSDKCSIIMSIFIMLAVGAIFSQKIVSVLQKNQVIATTETLVTDSPPLTLVKTSQY